MSNDDDAFDERYVRFREHASVLERVTALEGKDAQIFSALARIEQTINARPTPPPQIPQQETAAALALHRALDALDRNKQGGFGVQTFLSWLGLLALGGGIAWVVLH